MDTIHLTQAFSTNWAAVDRSWLLIERPMMMRYTIAHADTKILHTAVIIISFVCFASYMNITA